MTMTVGDLIAALEEFDENSQVLLAIQPGWPFEHEIGQIVGVDLSALDEDQEAEIQIMLEEEQAAGALPGPHQWEARKRELQQEYSDENRNKLDNEHDSPEVVYISEAGQRGYLPGVASETLGWR